MTTLQIRRNIHITDYHLSVNAISISYIYFCKLNTFIALPNVALPLLKAALVIDDWSEEVCNMHKVKIDDSVMWWDDFACSYRLNQYDCIEIITRHLMEKELETDANMLEIDEALKALQDI